MLTSERREKKQGKIRNSEYYGMESIFDTLYAESRNGKTFNHLMAIIESEENIKLAYRTIKRNHGSKTPGVDKKTIRNLAKLSEDEYVRLVKKKFSNYHPRPVRREEIPKDNGKTRPLGIPAISDRIVQQCILQVMEPICEAKFSENSNGFRPNRSAETAIAQCCRLIQVQHLYHVVDLDIKGFFDNINHTKLIRQIWSLGIRDKKLLCIIKQMLKASVILPNGEKIYPTKGTPQGGILSPLLANIVLNELDWWIASQWENMPTRTEFTIRQNRSGAEIKSHVYRALRRSNLKEMHSVRYADDFKIFCSSHEDAVKAYHATAKWLKDRLGLDVSPEKSRIVNLKRQYVDVARLKVLKADHQSQQYRLEDKLMKYFPAEIEKTQGFIKGFQSDIRTVAAHPLPEEGFCGMAVNGTCFTEKVEAGEAILAICKANQSLEPVPLGSYRGFKMELTFDSFQKEYQVLLKGEMTHRVPIGTSAAGNIQRLDNALAGIPARLEKAEQQLDNLRSQQEAAQAELGKPFPQEAELAEKSVRLAELDALLNMDDRGNDDPDRERTTEKPSVLAELRDRAGRIPPMTHRDDEEVAL